MGKLLCFSAYPCVAPSSTWMHYSLRCSHSSMGSMRVVHPVRRSRRPPCATMKKPADGLDNNNSNNKTISIAHPVGDEIITTGDSGRRQDLIVLFDCDGTLTTPRLMADAEMLMFLKRLREKVVIGMVGGSDLVKQREQLGDGILDIFDYTFSENGLVAYKGRDLISEVSFHEYLGEEKLQKVINFLLHYIADLDIPVKRGTFIEFRQGMLNVSPIGRNCSREERIEFEQYDKAAKVRQAMVTALQDKFPEYGLKFSIGGQISLDLFPVGWDKTYALRFVESFKEIHFFGDKTYPGGNDYEIYESDRTIGHSVNSPEDTMRICKELFLSN